MILTNNRKTPETLIAEGITTGKIIPNGVAERAIREIERKKKLAKKYINSNYKKTGTELPPIAKEIKIINYTETLARIKNAIVINLKREDKVFDKSDTELIEFYKTLALYFSDDKRFEDRYILRNNKKDYFSLKKGLLITGVPGRGKTFAMQLFQQFTKIFNTHNHFNHLYIDNMVNEVRSTNKTGIIHKNKKRTILIDELGSDKTKIHYNTIFLSELLLYERHKIFMQFPKIKTHAISNLDASGFRQRFEERIYGRIFQLFNIIDLKEFINYR